MIPRRMVPGMRWWCTPAVDMRDEICRDCYNAAVDPTYRLCGACIARIRSIHQLAISRLAS